MKGLVLRVSLRRDDPNDPNNPEVKDPFQVNCWIGGCEDEDDRDEGCLEQVQGRRLAKHFEAVLNRAWNDRLSPAYPSVRKARGGGVDVTPDDFLACVLTNKAGVPWPISESDFELLISAGLDLILIKATEAQARLARFCERAYA
jgi:hypothetical protein